MPATAIQLCLYDRMHRRKFPNIDHLCGAQALTVTRKILMSGAESEKLVWVCELVNYQMQLEKTLPMFQES